MCIPHGSRVSMLLAVAMLLGGVAAQGELIIDTGDPPARVSGWSLYGVDVIGDANYEFVWLAAEIDLAQAYTVTAIEAWLWEITPGDISVAIYGDGGDVPDTGVELFRNTFYADIPYVPLGFNNQYTLGWEGPQGLSWNLGPGSYWVALEVLSSSVAEFAATDPAANPLSHYALDYGEGWQPGGGNWGLRVYGTAESQGDVVPEPATVTLCGLGLIALAGRSIRNRRPF